MNWPCSVECPLCDEEEETVHLCLRCCYFAREVSLQESPASPSASGTRGRAKNTRGSLPRVQHSGKSFRESGSRGRGLPRVSKIVHSGKASPSATVALGEDLTPSVPSTFFYSSPSVALGEEIRFFLKNPLPRVQHSGKPLFLKKEKNLPRVPWRRHSGKPLFLKKRKKSSPSALEAALGEAPFLEKRKIPLPRVPLPKHSGKPPLIFFKKITFLFNCSLHIITRFIYFIFHLQL
jgi:hypothetical protein